MAMAAAAALRGAARNLVGRPLVRRTVRAGEQRRLSPRLLHTDEALRLEEEEARAMKAIQDKKEELYNMISEARGKKYGTGVQNQRLQQYLSAQITPRPYDYQWCRFQRLNRIHSFKMFMLYTYMAGFTLLVYLLGELIKEAKDLDRKEMKALE